MQLSTDARQLTVLQIIGNLDIGGAQEVVRTLSTYLVDCGCRVIVCTFKDGPLRSEIEQLGISVEVLPGRNHSILSFPQFLKEILQIRARLSKIVHEYQVDVIQTHILRSLDFLVATLRFFSNYPLVFWTVHNAHFALRPDQLPRHRWLLKPKQVLHNRIYHLVSTRINGFIAVSDEVKRSILDTIKPKEELVTVICNGVDVDRYQKQVDRQAIRSGLGLEATDRLIAVVGTLKEQKGHRVLIEALRPAISRYPHLHAAFIGDGELRETLQAQVVNCGLERNIHFLGNRPDVPNLLGASDYFILPSLWEGLPMALIEAMASGLPVISTRVSGTQQVVIDGVSGILVPPGDVKQLENAITDLLSSSDRAQALGKAARQRVETEFGARKQAEQHLILYQHARNRTHYGPA